MDCSFFFEQRHSLAFSNQLHEDSFVLSHEFSSSLCISVKKRNKIRFYLWKRNKIHVSYKRLVAPMKSVVVTSYLSSKLLFLEAFLRTEYQGDPKKHSKFRGFEMSWISNRSFTKRVHRNQLSGPINTICIASEQCTLYRKYVLFC